MTRRHAWVRTTLVLTGLTAVLAALATPAVVRSDWWNTTLRIADQPSHHSVRPLPGEVETIWSARGIPPSTGLVASSTVVAASEHAIIGHDPDTGQARWEYRRDNATLCAWTVQDDHVIAAFRNDGGCSDLIALDAGTGQRRWYRNAALDADITLSSASGVLVAGSAGKLDAFDTVTGLDRWTYSRTGCRFGAPLAGELGVAVIAQCHEIGPLLALHHASEERELWGMPIGGTNPQLVSATGRVAVFDGDSGQGAPERTAALSLYDEKGTLTGLLTAEQVGQVRDGLPAATVVSDMLLAWTGSHVLGIDVKRAELRWFAEASGPVSLDDPAQQHIVIPSWDAFSVRDPSSGQELDRVALTSGQVAGISHLARVSGAVVTAGPSGTTVYS